MKRLRRKVISGLVACALVAYPATKTFAAAMTYDWSKNPVIGYGYTTWGDYTLCIQYMLYAAEYKGSNGLPIVRDSSFGGNTYYALKNFQRDTGLSADGVAGRNTWLKFKSAVVWESDDANGYGSYYAFLPGNLFGYDATEEGVTEYFQERTQGYWYLGKLNADGSLRYELVD